MERNRQVLLYRCATRKGSFTLEVAGGVARSAALEPRTDALVRISALVALGAPEALCRTAIARAIEAGANDEDVVATLAVVATIIGHARLTAAAPVIALGLGYEVDSALCA